MTASADTPSQNPLAQLHQQLVTYFSANELKILCMQLAVDYEQLAGDEKGAKARSLVLHLLRRGRIGALVAEAAVQRPNVQWPTVSDEALKIFKQLAEDDKTDPGTVFKVEVSGGTVGKIININEANEITIN